ncbi:zinc-binding dehydrogenase [Amycolatopsis sp. NBC_01480]|uniref:zinc-binding dehydrogenase n=1 Tax=Amycolatopsis sp. NBC_01480 TaxID=2903562 RepID=UPI002E2C8D8F|nr:zinc-binding dehydrogenase [Amycolatopsis sp. NBC_01480]
MSVTSSATGSTRSSALRSAGRRSSGLAVSPLGGPPSFERDVTARYTGTTTPTGRLGDLASLAATGALRVEIGAEYAFSDARQALTDFTNQHIRGKVVVVF